jgi:hypothetical protein
LADEHPWAAAGRPLAIGLTAREVSVATLSARQLNRATLARQLLLGRERLGVVEAMGRIVALQAQEPPSPYLALWSRITDFDPAELDRALADHAIVKATLMRITMHAVAATDYPAFHEAMQVTLRAARLNDRRFTAEGLTSDEADALIPEVTAFASAPRRNADVEAWLEQRFGTPKPRVWWALRQYGPFVHAPSGGPWSFGPRPWYIAAPEQRRPGDAVASMATMIRRYLEGFGPASITDMRAFVLTYVPYLKEAVSSLGDVLVRLTGPGGRELYDVHGGLLPDPDLPTPPRLLPMWDSTLLAYADRSRTLPAEHRPHVIRSNGDLLPTLLVDGYVAGVWRPSQEGIEATAFHRLPDDAWDGLDSEARSLLKLLADREPAIYRRYAHWWTTLPRGEVRLLGR